MKLVKLSNEIYGFKCPGCRGPQQLPLLGPNAWKWNGSMELPTIQPSILTWHGPPGNERKFVCHSYVTDGKIQFLTDCTHALAGQTVELPDVETERDLFYKPSELK